MESLKYLYSDITYEPGKATENKVQTLQVTSRRTNGTPKRDFERIHNFGFIMLWLQQIIVCK
jgi:hypothetical protein